MKQPVKFERLFVDSGVRLELFQDEVCQFGKQNAIRRFPSNDDGDFWRINNIQELFQNAKQASEPTYVSSSFDIDNGAYQISLKLYLNGDEMARNTFSSLYVRVIRDPSHSNFTCSHRYARVLLCLYDTSSKHNHLIHKLTLDINDEYFQQAQMDEDKWSKISNFCRLSMIVDKEYGYIHQDTMILKTHVDFHISP
jgi:hypothetical protein